MQREALASVAGLESGMAAKQEAVSAADDAVKAHLHEVSTPSRLHGPKPSLDVFACLPACLPGHCRDVIDSEPSQNEVQAEIPPGALSFVFICHCSVFISSSLGCTACSAPQECYLREA